MTSLPSPNMSSARLGRRARGTPTIPPSAGRWPRPLERCAELLGIDLATLRTVAADVEPYLRVGGTKVWSLMQLERRLRPTPTGASAAATSAADAFGARVPEPQLQERLAVAEPRAARVIPALAGPQHPPAQPIAQQRPRRPIHRRRHPGQQLHLLGRQPGELQRLDLTAGMQSRHHLDHTLPIQPSPLEVLPGLDQLGGHV
jgi:hypothetical protein